jgi:hypothetical protein
MTLTPDQELAKTQILAWAENTILKTDYDYFITLAGYAGTGKTTVINNILQQLRHKKIVVSAPTHKAKNVIAASTNKTAETIQKLLGLRPDVDLADFNPNKPVFMQMAEETIQFYNILVIDESSMLNEAAVNLIFEKAVKHRVKVIFMGDKYQLPPVGEVLSKIFNLPNVVYLDTIVRQSNTNPNQKLIEIARDDVRNGTDHIHKYIKEVKHDMNDKEGFKVLNKEHFYPALIEKYYDAEYNQNPNLVKTIAWTNKSVKALNLYIRSKLLPNSDLVTVGDILMGYKPITKEIQAPPYYIPLVENSADYIVTKVTKKSNFIVGVPIEGYDVEFKDKKYPVFILARESYPVFIEQYKQRLSVGKTQRRWKSFYEFKDAICIIEDIYDENLQLVCSKDIDYGYAITVHKSQGSTYTNVCTLLSDICRNRTAADRRKLIYVALSRTSQENIIYDNS